MNIELTGMIKELFDREEWGERELKERIEYLEQHPDFLDAFGEICRQREDIADELMETLFLMKPSLKALCTPKKLQEPMSLEEVRSYFDEALTSHECSPENFTFTEETERRGKALFPDMGERIDRAIFDIEDRMRGK